MSETPGRREVAQRVFGVEYDASTLEYSERDDERAPNYVVTPVGTRINRAFIVGVLTEVERVSDAVLRARVADPTDTFVLYAGQYQPDAVAFLEEAEVPTFVAVTGKARTFSPADSDRVLTSLRPESITEVEEVTRDRWIVRTAEQTLIRVGTCAVAVNSEMSGEALRAALATAGVNHDLAAGIPVALDHYGTTEHYLASIADVALDALRVVAGQSDSVSAPEITPDAVGDGTVDHEGLARSLDGVIRSLEPVSTGTTMSASTEKGEEMSASDDDPTSSDVEIESAPESDPATADSSTAVDTPADEPADEAADDSGVISDDPGEFTPGTPSTAPETGTASGEPVDPLDEQERERLQEEYETEFQPGTAVADPGESGIEAEAGAIETDPESSNASETSTAGESSAGDSENGVDLTEAVLQAMDDLDEGQGADREAVIERVVELHDVDGAMVEQAIQDALMEGRCFEPDDGRLQAI